MSQTYGHILHDNGFTRSIAHGRNIGSPNLSGNFDPNGTYAKPLPDGNDSRYGFPLGDSQGPVVGGDGSPTQILLDAKAVGWPDGALIPDGYVFTDVDRLDMLYVRGRSGFNIYNDAFNFKVQHQPPPPPDPKVANLHANRFSVTINFSYEDAQKHTVSGSATAYPANTIPGDTTALFWFLGQENLEVASKLLGPVDGFWWAFVASLSSFAYTVTVKDTKTGTTWQYINPKDTFASHTDFRAFKD
jgi:hypothetical protein